MVSYIVSEEGHGKTKILLDMANKAVETAEGNLVFIDGGKTRMYDLNHNVRLVDTASYDLANYREFIGFLCGILSQNMDITDIFVDGINKIVKTFDDEAFAKLHVRLKKLSEENDVKFVVGVNSKAGTLPEEIKSCII
ncbi:MAG: twitching motility protein PilT [Defluviitaleaceae bacterium]|nr:twitching motility protein PilT [Defluviitaleaceae bacterium]